jgi:hypothetical protein
MKERQTLKKWSRVWIDSFGVKDPEIQDLFYVVISGHFKKKPDMIKVETYTEVVTITLNFLKVIRK